MARLIVNPGSPVAWEIQLKPGINTIGRGADKDFKIADPSVSGTHCQILVNAGTVTIRDLGSTNGTYVNRSRVLEAVLHHGETIHLGGVELLFSAEASTAAPVSPSPVRAVPLATPGAPPMRVVAPARVEAPNRLTSPPPLPALVPIGSTDTVPSVKPAPPGHMELPPLASPVPVGAAASSIPLPPQPPPSPPAAIPARLVTPSSRTVSITPPRPIGSTLPATPPPVAIPSPPAPTAAPPVTAAGTHFCKFHPKTPARFLCNQCRHYFCDLCVTTRTIGDVAHKTCRHCGIECTPVQVRVQRPVEAGFFQLLPGAFAYPARGAGMFLMLAGILIFAGLRWGWGMMLLGGLRFMITGVFLQVIAGGYLFTYLQSIIHSTAAGEREIPELPSMSNFMDDIFMPFFRLLGLILVCFGPLAIGFLGVPPALLLAIALLGALYFPMAFLSVAILDSVGAANPLVVIPSILKVPLEYLATVILLILVLGLRPLGDFLVASAFPRGIHTKHMGELLAYFGANGFWGFMSFYLLVVAVHILALLYVAKKQKLAWLDR
jgi:hypothetical protein